MCLDYFNLKSLLWKVCDSKLDNGTFDFIKILAQIINNLIYTKIIKVLWYVKDCVERKLTCWKIYFKKIKVSFKINKIKMVNLIELKSFKM